MATTLPRSTPSNSRTSAGSLSPREREIFELLAQGVNGKEIAHRLGVSKETVSTHARNGIADWVGDEDPPRGLTPREAEVLQSLAMGISGPEVGERLSISYATVRAHTRNAMAKLGGRTQAHVIALALKRGLIDPPP